MSGVEARLRAIEQRLFYIEMTAHESMEIDRLERHVKYISRQISMCEDLLELLFEQGLFNRGNDAPKCGR